MNEPRPRLVANLALLAGTVLPVRRRASKVALRLIFARSLDFGMEMWKYAVELKRPVEDPQLSFVHVPNRSAVLMGVPRHPSIRRGLRDHEYPLAAKPPGVYRMVMLGTRRLSGWGVPVEQTVAKILEHRN